MDEQDVEEIVREKYGQAPWLVRVGGTLCCSASSAFGEKDPITADLHGTAGAASIPEEAVRASLGCGDPTALAELSPGEPAQVLAEDFPEIADEVTTGIGMQRQGARGVTPVSDTK